MFKKDSLITGLVLAVIVPFSLYGMLQLLFHYNSISSSSNLDENLQLFLIAINGILFWYFITKRNQERTGKGVFLITFLYVIVYVIVYHL